MTTAAEYNIDIYQGDRKELNLRIREATVSADGDVIPGDYIDLTGYTVKSDIKLSKDDASPVVSWTCTVDPDQSEGGGKRGLVNLLLLPADTKLLTEEEYFYDVQVKKDTANITTYLYGIVSVTQEVTDDA